MTATPIQTMLTDPQTYTVLRMGGNDWGHKTVEEFRALPARQKLYAIRLLDQSHPLAFYRAGQNQPAPDYEDLVEAANILADALLQPQPEIENLPTVQHDMGEFLRARSVEGSPMRQHAERLLAACADTYVEAPVRRLVTMSPLGQGCDYSATHTGFDLVPARRPAIVTVPFDITDGPG